MEELADASALRDDPAALRRRLAADGYLFFRGLLPEAAVRAAASSVLGELRRGGWVTAGGIAPADRRALDFREALGHPAFRAALASPAFNRIPYLDQQRRLIRAILGPRAFSYPVKVLRAVYPERPGGVARGRYVHQDYAVTGVQDMLTTWVPLMAIPTGLGGLALGHHGLSAAGRPGIPLPDRARRAAQPRHVAAPVRGLPVAAGRSAGPSSARPRPRGRPAGTVQPPAGQRAVVGAGPGHDPVPAGIPGGPAAGPIMLLCGPPRLGALAAARPASPLGREPR